MKKLLFTLILLYGISTAVHGEFSTLYLHQKIIIKELLVEKYLKRGEKDKAKAHLKELIKYRRILLKREGKLERKSNQTSRHASRKVSRNIKEPHSSEKKEERYDEIILKASEIHALSPALIKSIIRAESNFNPKAISSKGAKGLMQLMPETARMLGVDDPFDPVQNILGGTKYFSYLLKRFDYSASLALIGYNAGPRVAERIKRYPHIQPPRETQKFIRDVARFYMKYRNFSSYY